jgi:hypothetical protein
MLLTQLHRLPSAAGIFQALEAVDASRRVTLTEAQESMLHDVIQHWVNDVGARNLPPGIYDLRPMRHRLVDEDATAD